MARSTEAFARTIASVAALPLVALVAVFLIAGAIGVPHEDSSIIYSYSRSLALTGTISYYPGGEVAEGATSFLWMIALAVAAFLHLDPHILANLLNIVGCGLMVWAAWLVLEPTRSAAGTARTTRSFGWVFFSVVLVTGVAAAPQFGFATLPFTALLILASAMLWRDRLPGAAIAAVLACLVRPDGLVYVAAIGLGHLAMTLGPGVPASASARPVRAGPSALRHLGRLAIAGAAVLACFGLYWAWRAHYFDQSYPLPYHVKSTQSAGASAAWLRAVTVGKFAFDARILLSLFLLTVLAVMAWRSRGERIGRFCLAALVVSSAFLVVGLAYLCRFRLLQNIGHRFEATAFLFVLFWFSIAAVVFAERVSRRAARWGLVALIAVAALSTPPLALGRGLGGSVFEARANNIRPLAQAMKRAAGDAKVTLLLTEAGRFAYYTGFVTTDAWGLNTPRYAAMPLVEPGDVAALDPTIVLIHGSKSRGRRLGYLCDPLVTPVRQRDWIPMTQALFAGAAASPRRYMTFAVPVWKFNLAPRRDILLIAVDHPAYDPLVEAVVRHGGERLGLASALLAAPTRCRTLLSTLRP